MPRRRPEERTSVPGEIPDKLYFRIGEVANLCGVPPYVLRFWENEFPQLRPGKSGTGQRLYRRREVETALRIKALLYGEGYTIAGARQSLASPSRRQSAEPAPTLPAPVLPLERAGLDAGPGDGLHMAHLRAELREILRLLSTPVRHREGTEAPSPGRSEAAGKLFE